jgi:hypothetical protein
MHCSNRDVGFIETMESTAVQRGVHCYKSVHSIAVLSDPYRRILNNGNLPSVVE